MRLREYLPADDDADGQGEGAEGEGVEGVEGEQGGGGGGGGEEGSVEFVFVDVAQIIKSESHLWPKTICDAAKFVESMHDILSSFVEEAPKKLFIHLSFFLTLGGGGMQKVSYSAHTVASFILFIAKSSMPHDDARLVELTSAMTETQNLIEKIDNSEGDDPYKDILRVLTLIRNELRAALVVAEAIIANEKDRVAEESGINHPRLKSGACEDPQAKRVQRDKTVD